VRVVGQYAETISATKAIELFVKHFNQHYTCRETGRDDIGIFSRPFTEGHFVQPGDAVNRDRESFVGDDGYVNRTMEQVVVENKEAKFIVPDGEAALSNEKIEELYIQPAAHWLEEQTAEVELFGQPMPNHSAETEIRVLGPIRLARYYDHQAQGTKFDFQVVFEKP